MEEIHILKRVVEAAIKKYGTNAPVTFGSLLAVLKIVEQCKEEEYEQERKAEEDFWDDPNNHS